MKYLHSTHLNKTTSTSFIYEIGSVETNDSIFNKQNILNETKLAQKDLQKDIENRRTEELIYNSFKFKYKNKTGKEITFSHVTDDNGKNLVSILIDGVETGQYLNNATKKITFKETEDPSKIEATWTDWKEKGGERGSFLIEVKRQIDLETRIHAVNNLLTNKEYKYTLGERENPTQILVYMQGIKGASPTWEFTEEGKWTCIEDCYEDNHTLSESAFEKYITKINNYNIEYIKKTNN